MAINKVRQDYKFYIKPTFRPDLGQNLMSVLLKHMQAVALPRNALGKTSVLKQQIKLNPGTNPSNLPTACHTLGWPQ